MNNPKELLTRFWSSMLLLLWAMAWFAFFQGWYHYHFFYQEQNQLFLNSWSYLITYFDKPAWLACMLGDWLTQFYYYLYAGPSILCATLFILGIICRQALRTAGIQKQWIATAFAMAVMTTEAVFSFHYDYRLSSLLAVIGGATAFWLSTLFVRRINKHSQWLSAIMIFLTTALTFWLFGSGIWMYSLLIITGWLIHIKEANNYLHLGFLAITLFLISLGKRVYFLPFDSLYSYPGIGKLIMPQMNLEKTFSADDEYYFGNYGKLTKMVEADPEPNQYMKFYYNLVMAQQGKLPDKLLAFSNNYLGTFENVGPDTPTLTIKTINELYWILGDMTFAERAAILGTVNSPNNRNIRMTKRLAEINIVSGEWNAARKYLRILQKTFVWRTWAENLMKALDHPEGEHQGLLKTYQEKANLSNLTDTIRLSDNTYTIMQELLESNCENHIALDYLLCSDLLLKDMDTFKRDYDRFCYRMENPPYQTKLYQEALMIYLAGTHASQTEWMKYIHRTDLLERFQQYNKQRGSAAFADTYWYYFDNAEAPKLTK